MTLLQAQVYMNITWDGAYNSVLFIKGTESLFSRKLLRDHFKIIWGDMLASYKSSGKQINYIRKKSTQGKKIYKLLMKNIKSGTENPTTLPKRNNKGRNPIYFSKRIQKRTYDLSAWAKSVMESVSQGGLSSPIFHLHYRFEPGAIPLSTDKVKCYS